MVKTHIAGTAIQIYVEAYGATDSLITPDTTKNIIIYDQDGVVVQVEDSMTATFTGKLTYDYQTAENDKNGLYTVRIIGQDSGAGQTFVATEQIFNLKGDVIGHDI